MRHERKRDQERQQPHFPKTSRSQPDLFCAAARFLRGFKALDFDIGGYALAVVLRVQLGFIDAF